MLSHMIASFTMNKVVLDTNIFVYALLNKNGAPRHIIRLALQNEIKPIFGNALLKEYEDVLSREKIIKNVPYPQVKD